MKFPDEFPLERPDNYFDSHDNAEAVAYVEARNELFRRAQAGTVYIKFVDGDRKGSIARLTIDEHMREHDARIERAYLHYGEKERFEIKNAWIYGIAKWDKPKRSCQVTMPGRDAIFLPNYEGPTVYQMFDRKAAKEELLKSPNQRDVDGQLLSIGDKVLYINARYGSGFALCHGTITEFRVAVDSKAHGFATIVTMDGSTEESAISYPERMIFKK